MNVSDDVAKDQLTAFVERIERLEEEKKGISDDIKEVYAEAKGNGFEVKILWSDGVAPASSLDDIVTVSVARFAEGGAA